MPNTTKPSASTQHLRHITVFVDEPDPGCYYWVIIESKHDPVVWEDVEGSEQAFHSWLDAFQAGTLALMKHVENPQIGPIAPSEDETASPVGGMPIAD